MFYQKDLMEEYEARMYSYLIHNFHKDKITDWQQFYKQYPDLVKVKNLRFLETGKYVNVYTNRVGNYAIEDYRAEQERIAKRKDFFFRRLPNLILSGLLGAVIMVLIGLFFIWKTGLSNYTLTILISSITGFILGILIYKRNLKHIN